jgi:thiosulfate/3-mercaptopyruvate sulfurtransferase
MTRIDNLAGLLLAVAAGAAQAVELPGPLVSTEWLAANAEDVLVLDVRADPDSYVQGGHIIGAVELSFGALRGVADDAGLAVPDMSVGPEAFAEVLRAAGLDAGEPVVLSHRGRGPDDTGYAAYVYWQLRRFGHDQVAILDGGAKKWVDEGREIWGEVDTAEPGDFTASETRPNLAVDTAEVRARAAAGGDLIDARPFTWFIGLEKRGDVAAGGHIPGAAPLPFNALFAPSGAFRPQAQLAAAAAAVGTAPGDPVVAYCNTGHVSALVWLTLSELLGYGQASIYDGSMLAWSKHGLPVETALIP